MAIRFIGASIGCGAKDHRSEFGPDAIRKSKGFETIKQSERFNEISWDTTLYPRYSNQKGEKAHPIVLDFSNRLQKIVGKVISDNDFPVVIGGDHSCAIGTWSGVARVLNEYGQGDLGLIWIDAHLDSHTFDTSPSNAIHGMPLAVLLGYGKPDLVKIANLTPKLKPENVKIIGARSYEEGEKKLLDSLGVEIFYMDDVHTLGFNTILQQCVKKLNTQCGYFGITLDLDALSPIEVTGVGSPENNGIKVNECLQSLEALNLKDNKQFICFELAEYLPELDDGNTLSTINKILHATLG